jgi:hypothetical protein
VSDVVNSGKPPASSKNGTPIGKSVRGWRTRATSIACLLSCMSGIAATAFFYLACGAETQSRRPAETAAAVFTGLAVVLLFRALDGRFAIQLRRSGNRQSSSVTGALLWIACFAAVSAVFLLVELRSTY